MLDETNNCPPEEQLRELIDGTLADDLQAQVQSHVDDCAACQQRLEALVAGSESWDAAVGHLKADSPRADETILSDAIKRMKDDQFIESGACATGPSNTIDFLAPTDHPGSMGRLGNYEVTEVVGQGGMGVVLKAFDPSLHRVVAVKVLAPFLAHNPQAKKRFIREGKAIAAVSHDHVITIHGIDEFAEPPRIIMQFVSGRSLQQKIDAEGSLDLKEILRIGMQTAAGLAAAHAQGLVHRDVKPSNILLENGIQRVKLTDFGLARAVDDASLTQSGAIAGTPQYMAPEQANGDAVDFRADLFSLGSVMYAMCVGHSPFRASTTMGVLKRVCHDPPRPIQELNPDIPDWLCAIISRLLEKKPEDRYSSARTVAEILEKWLAHVQQPHVVPKPPATSSRSSTSTSAVVGDEVSSTGEATSVVGKPDYGRSILFQPISFRWLLFFMLCGMIVSLSFGGSHSFEERLLLSFATGLVVGSCGMFSVAVIRFVWSHAYRLIYGGPKVVPVVHPGEHQMLAPESKALLVAVAMMLVGAHLLVAAIVAIIVWRISTAYDTSKRKQGPVSAASSIASDSPPDQPPSNDEHHPAGPTPLVRLITVVKDLLRPVIDTVGGLFRSNTTNRLLIAIAWVFAGGIDVLATFMIILEMNRGAPVIILAFLLLVLNGGLAIVSFAVAQCVYVRQNPSFVRMASFVSLIPMSLGAIVRIPTSIATLFWLESPETKAAFDHNPWNETALGKITQAPMRFTGRLLSIAVWLALWSAVCAAATVAIQFLYLIPYGPSDYHVMDNSIVQLKGEPNTRFLLTAEGSGSNWGRERTSQKLHRQTVVVASDHANSQPLLTAHLGGTVVNPVTLTELTESDVQNCFTSMFGQPFPEQAADLVKAVKRLDVIEGNVNRFASYPSPADNVIRIQGNGHHWASQQPPPGFVKLGSLLDPSLFVVDQVSRPSSYHVTVSERVLVALFAAAGLIWPSGAIRIVWSGLFKPASPPQPAMAMAAP